MTITIAAIVIGIGVDNAIHYLHRFKLECKTTHNVEEAVANSHNSIGSAIYFTSFTIVAGFSILIFSNFMPTVYFGLFTSLAMLLALMANLLILPSLLVNFYRQ
jgi:predicted RND superfamily exporter protein